ncbi:MAG: outer membrane protein assembly factor BamE [Endozoicomonadaceae bacterium]|nr:outer membrane protein assembly factor BamE [Endozoicomonadaceae bacterium]
MQKYLKVSTLAITAALIGGCSLFSDNELRLVSFPGVYKIDIQQGNIINKEMINQLRPGMTRSQVVYIMGSSLLPDSFDKDRLDYVYTLQSGDQQHTQQTLSLFFQEDKLIRFSGNFHPEINQDANSHTQSNIKESAKAIMKKRATDERLD